MSERYLRSETMLVRALRAIPLGTQTFSKSMTQFPFGVSPFFVTRGQGCRLWDLDGNEYIDFVNSQCAITLGYGDPDVTAAVHAQLEDGVIFSLPHPLEVEVAEAIIELVPCAEMVRFGKNGSDATSGAVRASRAFTGRDHVAVCGYHGWQDWYIGSTTRNLGVPESTRALTHRFAYNSLDSLQAIFRSHPDQVACVIIEPMNTTWPAAGFLDGVAAITRGHGAVLIFDEVITGFRYANGGAQQLFGVTPDLATFGKGLANGYPVSAVAGRADIMKTLEEAFFSFTFGGEALSLAAAKATLAKLVREPVAATIAERGQRVLDGVAKCIAANNAGHIASVSGHPSWSFLELKDVAPYTSWEIKTLYMQEMLARGFLAYGTHNLSYAHQDADISSLLAAYDEVLPLLREAVDESRMGQLLRCAPLEPLFRVR
jgi:glutamate-1-semialdehyde 2,1-aminomutase